MIDPWAAAVLVATIAAVLARQMLLRGPPVWALFGAGAVAMVAVGGLPLDAVVPAWSANVAVFGFLFALFVFAVALDVAGALDRFARWILGRAPHPTSFPLYLFIAMGALSAFVLNDAVVLVGVPVVLVLARRLKAPPIPLLLTLAYSVTVGSVLTPFGNPQDLLVSIGSGMTAPVATFLRYLLVPTAINLVLGGLYLRWRFAPQLADALPTSAASEVARIPLLPKAGLGRAMRRHPALYLFPVTMGAIVALSLAASFVGSFGPPLYWIALAGAAATLALSAERGTVLRRVDWSILVLFAGLFVVVAGAVRGGVLEALQGLYPLPGPANPRNAIAAILAEGVGGSQVVSNVPWVGLQIPLLHARGYGPGTPWAWLALSAGSTLAGSATLLGAASNLIVVERSEREGVRIALSEFVRYGLPLTALTVTVLFVTLSLGV